MLWWWTDTFCWVDVHFKISVGLCTADLKFWDAWKQNCSLLLTPLVGQDLQLTVTEISQIVEVLPRQVSIKNFCLVAEGKKQFEWAQPNCCKISSMSGPDDEVVQLSLINCDIILPSSEKPANMHCHNHARKNILFFPASVLCGVPQGLIRGPNIFSFCLFCPFSAKLVPVLVWSQSLT